ncbi:MAG TPA: hypothetical protein VLC52_16090, partial [Anaerolineae bacterium]|nr:hypothetical protein [Anaerolineae bacterium]
MLLLAVSALLASCTATSAPTPAALLTTEAPTETVTAGASPANHVAPSSTPPPTTDTPEPATAVPAWPTATPPPVVVSPTLLAPTAAATVRPVQGGSVGLGLRRETAASLQKYADRPGFVMCATVGLAEIHFPELEGWIRVLGAPSLELLRQKAEQAAARGLPYEGLAYGLETSSATPREEWQDLVGSTEKARAIADEYGKLLVMGPGFRLMSENPERYPEMAALSDMWVLQTQRLQVDGPGAAYRDSVQRVVDQIRAGNPGIAVWAQITLPPDREPSAEEWLAYRQSIADLVDGTFIGVYVWETAGEEQ